MPQAIELNEKFKLALDLMENTDKSVFVTGRAGTGKSTLLDYFRLHTRKNIVVLASTGVAAVNIKGQTVHSFFKFKPDITLSKVKTIKDDDGHSIYRKLEAIVIDEVSMIRADLMDCIDKFMRLNGRDGNRPFGGVQMIYIGDLYQLPPVVTAEERNIFNTHYDSPYFFSAKVFNQAQTSLLPTDSAAFELIELEKIYRQNDDDFIGLLNSIRDNTVTWQEIKRLNDRLAPEFEPSDDEYRIYLTTTNKLAADINEIELLKLEGETITLHGEVTGDFTARDMPTDQELEVKLGAQVMLLNNDPEGRWVNGTIGRVVAFRDSLDWVPEAEGGSRFQDSLKIVDVELTDGTVVDVRQNKWDIYRFKFNHDRRAIESEAVGSFIQYPFKLAWAITIHKSQGKTFDKVIIDIGSGTFSSGQLYVALSRCRTFDGIILKRRIYRRHVWLDRRVVEWGKKLR